MQNSVLDRFDLKLQRCPDAGCGQKSAVEARIAEERWIVSAFWVINPLFSKGLRSEGAVSGHIPGSWSLNLLLYDVCVVVWTQWAFGGRLNIMCIDRNRMNIHRRIGSIRPRQ